MVGSDKQSVKLPVVPNFACSAFSASFAETITLPLDTAKVRLQVQPKGTGAPQYKGLVSTVMKVAADEGPGALWKGLEPGIHRQCFYGGLRIGLYDPIKTAIGGDGGGFAQKVGAGLLSGGIAISIANPTDLVKVRMQSEGKKPPGEPRKYRNAFHAYYKIAAEEGFFSLWRGVLPNVTRNAIINAAELASYDQIKQSLLATSMFQDNVITHLVAGLGAGFFAVICGSPVDVAKSRIMADKTGQYKGIVDCFVKTAANDGILAFYNGFFPNFMRLGTWNVIMFLTLEQTKIAMNDFLNKGKEKNQ